MNAPAGFVIEPDDPTLTLLVARRSGVHVVGGHVNVADDARDALRRNADRAIEDLETMEVRRYDPDAQLEEGRVLPPRPLCRRGLDGGPLIP